MDDTDILIAGGGIAGLTLAARLAAAGRQVTVIDPAAPPDRDTAPEADLRSTAFLQPARRLLEHCGLWDRLAPRSTPLDALRIIDTAGWPPEIRAERTFRPEPDGDEPAPAFGWNLPNWLTRYQIGAALADRAGVTLRWGAGLSALLTREREALATLSDGTRLRARLVIGADGRASRVAEAAGIAMRTTRYGQKALAFAVSHDLAHGQISTEVYNSGGACTTVPLPDHAGRAASAIVWMEDGARAQELAALAPEALGAELDRRSCHILGRAHPETEVRVWPVITQRARQLTARRVALVAEAAHVLPPIGAQGLNTSLADVAMLAHALDEVEDPGDPRALARYAHARERDIAARATAINLFNRVCRSDAAPVQALRSLGLRGAHDLIPLRRRLISAGLGPDPE
ncbi:FAD-dependent oxidoreductase [Mesobaculum littorinae]|uniref:FAD-dependent oxidoreductase n=1 Tax=Mesobaculum littorinae TaxID=2486419 RepID=A0A438AJ96_9RHOB|nr:FAD-dependent monooxygenase [Mesobaculum littorinae]RVV98726.1 FAD-dependent oxidoreductase [Mesobaculum littorinae]